MNVGSGVSVIHAAFNNETPVERIGGERRHALLRIIGRTMKDGPGQLVLGDAPQIFFRVTQVPILLHGGAGAQILVHLAPKYLQIGRDLIAPLPLVRGNWLYVVASN